VSVPAARFATPRIAAGALFVSQDRILLVHKTYRNGWDIPGGYADQGESPAAACQREVLEELNLRRKPRQLLVTDWAPHPDEGDKILYIFHCGDIGADEARMELDGAELDHWTWVALDEVPAYVIPRLARRLAHAHHAYVTGQPLYLEHGCPAVDPASIASW
jgi:8-oxo-dGTP pyrophosphatase MutT (NUDIX family)